MPLSEMVPFLIKTEVKLTFLISVMSSVVESPTSDYLVTSQISHSMAHFTPLLP